MTASEPVKESPAGKTSLSKISSSFRNFHFAIAESENIRNLRRQASASHRRCGCACREATAREGHCGGAVGFVLEVVAGGEVESCAGGRSWTRPRWAWSMPPGVGVLEIRAWEPAGAGDSGYFPRGIVPGPRCQPRGKFRNDDVVFFLEVAPVSEGDSFTRTGGDGTRGLVFRGLRAASGQRTARGG